MIKSMKKVLWYQFSRQLQIYQLRNQISSRFEASFPCFSKNTFRMKIKVKESAERPEPFLLECPFVGCSAGDLLVLLEEFTWMAVSIVYFCD